MNYGETTMITKLDLQLVLKHLTNGTFGENMCRICLLPLSDLYENVFSKVCRENEEYCIADILKEICDIQFLDDDHYNVCSKCFVSAWDTYKFYLKARHNDEILHLYADNLLYNLDSIQLPENTNNETLFITLPTISSDFPTIESNVHDKICKKEDESNEKNNQITSNLKNEDKKTLTTPIRAKVKTEVSKKAAIEISLKPIIKIEEKPMTKIGEKPMIKIGEKPMVKIGEKPIIKIVEKPMTKIGEKPMIKIGEKPMVKIGEKPIIKIVEKPMTKIGEKPMIKIGEKPMVKIGEKPIIKIVNKPIIKIGENSVTSTKPVEGKKAKFKKNEEDEDNDELVIIMKENGLPSFHKMLPDGQLVKVENEDKCRKAFQVLTQQLPKQRVSIKKREPMTWKKCTQCPTRYRFEAKLIQHMRDAHGILLFSCKVCRTLVEDEDEYVFHTKTHTNVYQCEICDSVFKKRETIISHLAQHDKVDHFIPFVCKECGKITKDGNSLKIHLEEHNLKGHTCYYCGRMYKKEVGLNNHIKKHEMYIKSKTRQKQGDKAPRSERGSTSRSREFTCEVCGRVILSERALLWHRQLHTDDRPFTCKECGRGFVTQNRCRQHELCAHSAPALRCPLCPALFHMRSMVNTHIKKVHLKAHKRRTRTVRQQDVYWHTMTVPIQELSVDIQADILELQAAKQNSADDGMCVD